MMLLLLVASVPVIGIAGANAVLGYEAELAAGRRTAAILGEVAAARHGAILEYLQGTLTGLAREPRLGQEESCADLLRGLHRLNNGHYTNLWLIGADGTIRCSALTRPDMPDMAEDPLRREALASTGMVLSPFRAGRLTGLPVLTAALALPDRQGVIAVSLRLEAFRLAESRAARAGEARPRVWLVDREGQALSLTPGAAADELPSPELLATLSGRGTGQAVESLSRHGADFAYASARLEAGLGVLVGLPTGTIRAAAQAVLLRRALELAAFLLACLLVIVLGADFAIARPLRALAARVRQWRPGAPFGPSPRRGEPDEVRALEQAFAEAAQALGGREEELRNALRQRDLLMAEIHHRVKNNLQIVASLLNLQANRLRDPKARAEFATARDRVQALATLHRHLYTNQTFEVIALRPFLEELAQQLFAALGERPGQRIRLTVEADELEIITDQAVSLALLITETVTNAIKHGFADARSGQLTISVRGEGEEVTLRVHDDGLGMRLEEEESGKGIGLTLIRGFAQHLGGEIVMRHEAGTELSLRFPLRPAAREASAAQ